MEATIRCVQGKNVARHSLVARQSVQIGRNFSQVQIRSKVSGISSVDLNKAKTADRLVCHTSRGPTPTNAVVTNHPPSGGFRAEEEGLASEDLWQVKMLYDGDCPLCLIEVNALRDRNKSYGTIKFVDISDIDYNPEENAGVQFETAMGKIHCIQRDGTILKGIAAFQKFYDVLGMGWVYSITRIKPVGALADAVYDFWSKYRLPITGRPSLAVVLEERRQKKEAAASCDVEGRCQVDF